MAIKVGGTTVVDDSRNITGISISGLTTPLSVAQGGTGSASTAHTSLTTNVSGTLPIANGGTGAVTAGAAITALGGVSAGKAIAFAIVMGF
jgi:hypothetical protein